MTVLHLFDLYLPHTLNWVSRLMQATPRVEQWVAAPWILGNEYHHSDFRFFVRPLQNVTGWLPSSEWQAEWFSSNLIRAERRLPLYRNWLYGQLKNKRPDILHAHFGPVGCHYLEMAQRLEIPLITSFYGFDYTRLPYEKPIYRERYQRLFKGAAALSTTGALTPKLLENQACPPEKIHPIPVSISGADFPYLQRNKQPGQLRLVQVATITDKKGQLDTLAAFSRALPTCPNMSLSIVGERQDKKLFGDIQQFIQTNSLEQKVALLDFLSHQTLPAFLGQFDVFIHPSRTAATRDCEGAPVAILEAMSTGLPVISTFHSDIPMQVLQGKTGLLAPERDIAGLAAHIEYFYRMEQAEYQSMSQAARLHVEQNFEIKNTALKLSTLYQSMVHTS